MSVLATRLDFEAFRYRSLMPDGALIDAAPEAVRLSESLGRRVIGIARLLARRDASRRDAVIAAGVGAACGAALVALNAQVWFALGLIPVVTFAFISEGWVRRARRSLAADPLHGHVAALLKHYALTADGEGALLSRVT